MNGILKRTLSVWLMALAALAFAAPSRAESLADALISAYRNSGLLEQNRALLRAADEDVAASMAALRPILSYFASATYSEPVRIPGGDSRRKCCFTMAAARSSPRKPPGKPCSPPARGSSMWSSRCSCAPSPPT